MPDFDLYAMLARLDDYRAMSPEAQFGHRDELNDLFETAWRAAVDRETFSRLFHRIVLTPEMLWMIGAVPHGEAGEDA